MPKVRGMTTLAGLGFAALLHAAPEPVLDVADLVDKSDLIVVGRVTDIVDAGRTPVEASPGATPGYLMVANVEVADVIKGPSTLTVLRFHFATPDAVMEYRGIAVGAVRLFFLAGSGDTYEAVSRYYPSLPALSGQASGDTPFDRVMTALSRPLLTAATPSRLKHEVIQLLWFVPTAASVPSLRPALNDPDESVRLAAAAALLYNDDATVLPIVEALLLNPPPSIPASALRSIRGAIENGLRACQ